MSRPFASLYPGKCADCAEWYRPGTAVRFDEYNQVVHAECEGNTDREPVKPEDICPDCHLTLPCDCEVDR